MARCAPKCEKTVQALLCRNLNVKSATLPNATYSHRIRLQDDLVTKFHILVGKAFSCSWDRPSKLRVRALRQGVSLMSTSNAHEPELSPKNPFPSQEESMSMSDHFTAPRMQGLAGTEC
ncbi:hypothetical protein V6N13_061193 [Hibiscus sabdariffa]